MRLLLILSLLILPLLLLAACQSDDTPPDAGAETGLRQTERIVFFGDSITEAGDRPGGYVTMVRDSLHAAYPDRDIEVIGAGISGHKVPDLLARVDRDVLVHDPTTVVVYIGINDVWHSLQPEPAGTPEDVYEAGLRTLVDTLHQAGARVLLCTPSVIGERRTGENELDEMLDRYAEISRDVAAETGAETCDLRRAFTEHLAERNAENVEEGVLTTDGVHLNEAGNRFVAVQMIDALDS